MQPRIEKIGAKQFIGMSSEMSVVEDTTGQLFRTFMPRRKEIVQVVDANTFDLRIYPPNYFLAFNPGTKFTKWALVEVSNVAEVPSGMESFNLTGGKYAVFDYKGNSGDKRIFQYIFTDWLPNSNHQLADLPHFEILGPKTKLSDPHSEEEIWIPIQ